MNIVTLPAPLPSANRFCNLNRLAQVCAEYRDATALQINFLNCVGMSQHNLGNNQEAIALLTRALEVNKDNPESYINLATVLGHLGDTAGKTPCHFRRTGLLLA